MEMDAIDLPRHDEPFALWLFKAMGIRYTIWLPFFTVLAFVLALLAIWKFKTPHLTAVLFAVVPLPIFIGVMGVIDGLVASFQVIALSSVTPRASEMADGGAMSLVTLQVGLIFSLPIYFIAMIALCIRAFRHTEAVTPTAEPAVGAVYAKVL